MTQPPTFTMALVQLQWTADSSRHVANMKAAIARAASAGAYLIVLPELSLHPYFPAAGSADRMQTTAKLQECAEHGPTAQLCRTCSKEHRVFLVGSLFEHGGFNTAVIFGPGGELFGKCRKQHIPGTAGYAEHVYFKSGSATQDYPVFSLPLPGGEHVQVAVPTCYDRKCCFLPSNPALNDGAPR